MSNLEGLVRPAIMVILVVAQVGLAVAWTVGLPDAKDAFAALGTFTMMVVVFLFKARDAEKQLEAEKERNGTGGGSPAVTSTGPGATLTVVTPPAAPTP